MYKVMLPDTKEIETCDYKGFMAIQFIYNEYDFIYNDSHVLVPVKSGREFSERLAKRSRQYLR